MRKPNDLREKKGKLKAINLHKIVPSLTLPSASLTQLVKETVSDVRRSFVLVAVSVCVFFAGLWYEF